MSPEDVDLEGKVVRLKQSFFADGYRAEDNLFLCKGGFGCKPYLMGTKIYGTFLSDNEVAVITRECVEEVIEQPKEPAND